MAGALVFIFGLPYVGPELCCGGRKLVKSSPGQSELSPRATIGTRNYSFDHTHVRDSIGKGRRYGNIVENRAGERVGLKRILVARFEANFLSRAELCAGL